MKRIRPAGAVYLILLILIAGLPGCIGPQMTFHDLVVEPAVTPQPSSTAPRPTESSPTETRSEEDLVYLTLAVPFTDQTTQALRLLFLAREAGLQLDLSAPRLGDHVELDDLLQFEGPLALNTFTVPAAVGVSAEQVRAWRASATMPDLLYCSSAAALPDKSQLLPLNDWLYDNMLLSPELLYPQMLAALSNGQTLYSVPFLASTPLLCHHAGLLEQLNARVPPADLSWTSWAQWLDETQQLLIRQQLSIAPAELTTLGDDPQIRQSYLEKAIVLNSQLAAYLPFIAPAASSTLNWGMWQENSFALDHPEFRSSAAWLRELAQSGYGTEHLTETDLLGAFQEDRLISRLMDSASLDEWDNREPFAASFSLMPYAEEKEMLAKGLSMKRVPLHIRSLYVSRETENPELSVKLATFIAMDPDSLLMQSRFQQYKGLIPLIRDDAVWAALVAPQTHGALLIALRERLPYAYTGGQQTVRNWDAIIQEALVQAGSRYLTAAEVDLEDALRSISSTAAVLLHEGG